jgi:putative ABC transport system ATP-binding protein
MRSLNADGITILMVTHDPAMAAIASRQLCLRDGRLADAA